MDTYFLYARKSTDEPDRQILSIEAQITELKEFAAREHLTISRVFIESQTAKEPGRPIFNEMLSLVEKGKANGILAWHPDRLARNSVDGGRIIYLTDTGKIATLKFLTHWFEATPQGKFMLSIAFGQSKYYVDNLSENVKRGLRQKARRGESSGVAPTGYLNDRLNHRIVKDPERFRLVRQMFEMYATGNYSLRSLREAVFDMGLVSKSGQKLAIGNIQRILTKPTYYGAFLSNGELFAGTHEPLVSKKLFDTVQAVLTSKTSAKKRGEKVFPFRGLFSCGECGCSVTAEVQKGYTYYHCTKRKDVRCSQPYIREELLTDQIDDIIRSVALPQYCVDQLINLVNIQEKDSVASSDLFAEKLKGEIKACDDKLNILLDAHLERVLSRDEYTSKKNEVLSRKMDLDQKVKDFERRGGGRFELSRKLFLACSKGETVAIEKNIPKKIDFLKKLGSNRILSDKSVRVELINPWRILYEFKANQCIPPVGPKRKKPLKEEASVQLYSLAEREGFEPSRPLQV